ncbi:MAG: endonuclease/exonuclease/phosphatase family protein [Thermoanaerobaculia bacterium]|nr:endonuclease/exonuclease/phosphatase family protein [Thermoanaerobaculia bacterium]
MIRTGRLIHAAFTLPILLAACTTTHTPATTTPEPSVARIHAIQGAGHRSPLEGKRVESVEGVVTAVLASGRAPGFWMQDPKPDRDEATSEALFVSTKDATVDVAVGDHVAVSGDVAETGFPGALTATQIVKPEVRTLSRANTVPPALRVGAKGRAIPDRVIDDDGLTRFEPRTDAIDFWESIEGMLVEVHDAVVVGATSGYGDMVVLADGGVAAAVRSPRGGIVLQDHDVNPERIIVEPRLVRNPPLVETGDRVAGSIVGVVDYNFGNYRLLNTLPLRSIIAGFTPPEETAFRGDAEHVTVATYNVLNLGGTSDAARFSSVAESIVGNLGAPDVIGLQEMQDDSGPADDGIVTASATFAKLTDAIVAAGGPRYEFRQIDPVNNEDGGQPGGNIRVGILFNPARVAFVDRGSGGAADPTALEGEGAEARLTLSPGRVDPANPCFAGGGSGELAEPTRKSLAAELRFGDRKFFVIVNHLKSKRGDDSMFGSAQPPVFKTEEQRMCQAEIIGRFAASILARDPKAAVVVLGDMNEHEFRRPMRRLAELSGMENLVERVPVGDRYTFSFLGNLQVLDNVLVSPSLSRDASAGIDIVHVNADRADERAASDHDPIVVRIKP